LYPTCNYPRNTPGIARFSAKRDPAALNRQQIVIHVPADRRFNRPPARLCRCTSDRRTAARMRRPARTRGQPMYQAVAHGRLPKASSPTRASLTSGVRVDELLTIELEISLLAPARPAQNPNDFDLLNDGIYLTVGDSLRMLSSPGRAQTGWTRRAASWIAYAPKKTGHAGPNVDTPSSKIREVRTLLVAPEPFVCSNQDAASECTREGADRSGHG